MSLKIGDKLALTIHDIAFGGEGVGRVHVTRDAGQVTSDGNSPATTAGESLSPDTCHPSPARSSCSSRSCSSAKPSRPKSPRSKRILRGRNCCAWKSRRRSVSSRSAVISAHAAAASISTLITPAQLRLKHKQIADLFERVGKISRGQNRAGHAVPSAIRLPQPHHDPQPVEQAGAKS